MDAIFHQVLLIPTLESQDAEGASPVPAEPQSQGGTIEPAESVKPINVQE